MPGRLPPLVPRDDRERLVIQAWRASGRRDATIAGYLSWVRRYRTHCRTRRVDELERLTLRHVVAYARSYVGSRRGNLIKEASRRGARNALRAWSCALQLIGVSVPAWLPKPPPSRWPPLLAAYGQYRRSHRGVSASTLARDMELTSEFIRFLRARDRRASSARVEDIDGFVDDLSTRLSRRTVASLCSALRCFLRFLRVTRRIRRDLAACVVAPRFRSDEHPPRALPWSSVRRIMRAIPRDQAIGRRDYAMLLLMASYGLGSGEVVRLQMGDVDWRAGVLRARRPKTGVPLVLPLLPAVARAIASYIRNGRPVHIKTREIFVAFALPHNAIGTSSVRRQVRQYARGAGISDTVIGAHVFRHSHATRQIDAGANPKIVSDILGHRCPSSISVYVRVALQRLRIVALPVPR